MPKRLAAAAAMLGLLAGCTAAANDLPVAQDGVTRFHQMLNTGDSAGIYADSGPDFKKASTQADMVALFDAIHRKLGNFQSGKVTGWRENTTMSGTYVTLGYSASYDRSQVSETFSWRIDKGHAMLASYFITSNYMMVH
jgi:hypothetical protein